jgi:hypothetical protein
MLLTVQFFLVLQFFSYRAQILIDTVSEKSRYFTMEHARLQSWFPWVQTPIISNGPMLGVVTVELATEVSRAGGLGKALAPST